MSRKGLKQSKVAYMQEEDDMGNIIEDKGVTYAASTVNGPTKEKMNTSKKKSRRGDTPSPPNALTDSDSTVHPCRDLRSKSSSRREATPKKAVSLTRHPSRHGRPAPAAEETNSRRKSRDEPAYYAVDPAIVASSASRTRSHTAAPRPSNYLGPSRPPLANARYYMSHPQQPQQQPPPPPSSVFPGGNPPPLAYPHGWQQAPLANYAMMPPHPFPTPAVSVAPSVIQSDYSTAPPHLPRQKLQQRFNLDRPQTSIGHRSAPPTDYRSAYELDEHMPDMSRLSVTYKPAVEDGRTTAIPMRPRSARPSSFHASPFAPPPGPPQQLRGRLSPYAYTDETLGPVENAYHDGLTQYDYTTTARVARPRRTSVSTTAAPFDDATQQSSSRRNSMYDPNAMMSGNYEDTLRKATSYQDEVSGGSMRLTAEMLREANRSGVPSSRSTRSSGSRDESDWRQSATTRSTRSSNEEDLTIRVRGNALFKYGDAEMQCMDGTEINITSRGPPSSRRVISSDKSSYADADDRRSRFERPALQSRAASQAGSYVHRVPAAIGYSYGGGYDYASAPFMPQPSSNWS